MLNSLFSGSSGMMIHVSEPNIITDANSSSIGLIIMPITGIVPKWSDMIGAVATVAARPVMKYAYMVLSGLIRDFTKLNIGGYRQMMPATATNDN